MELILLFVMVFFAGYVAGWLGHARGMVNRLLENPDDMIRILNEYKKEAGKLKTEELDDTRPVREMEVEQENGQFYLYAKDNGQFLAQGPTLDEALAAVEKRFPNQTFQGVMSREEAKRLGIHI